MRMQELLLTQDSLLERADSVAYVGCLRRGSLVVVILLFLGNRFELIGHACSCYHLHGLHLRLPRSKIPWATHSTLLCFLNVLFHVLSFLLVSFGVGADRDDWSSEGRIGCLRIHNYLNLGILRLTSIQSIEGSG